MLTYAGMMLDEKGKYDAAEMLYRRVLQVEPKHLDCYCTYGLLLDRHGISQLYLLYCYKKKITATTSTNTDANAHARASRIGDAHV
jgi:hypothetical protein